MKSSNSLNPQLREGNTSPEQLARDTYVVILAVKKRWRTMLLFGTAVLLGVVFFTVAQKRLYRSVATIQIDPNPPKPLGNQVQSVVEIGAGSYLANKEYYATQYQLLKSRGIALMVVKQLGLASDPRFFLNLPGDVQISTPIGKKTLDDAAAVLLRRLEIEPLKDSRLATVSFEDADPMRAHRVLSTVVQTFLEQNIEKVVSSTSAASDWLRDQVGKLKTELETSELALHGYKKDKHILSLSLDDQSNMLRSEMQVLSNSLTEGRVKRESLLARDLELRKVSKDDPLNIPTNELLNSPILSTLRQNYVALKASLSEALAQGKGEHHPDVESAAAKVAMTRESLVGEIANVQGAVRSELSAIEREVQGLSGLLERAKQRAMDLNLLEIEYGRLARAKTNTEKLYGMVLERSKESELTSLMRFNNIYMVEPATVPKVPSSPRVPVNLGAGFALAVVVGLLAGLTREVLDRRVHNADDIEQELQIPCLGMLSSMADTVKGSDARPKDRRRRQNLRSVAPVPELTVHEFPNGGIAESARVIRTNIVFASPDTPLNRLLVTSASPGEGKTLITTTIAIAMAQADQKVLLIDCDLRRCRLHRIFGRSNDFGLSSAVLDPSLLDRHDLATGIPNLSLLTSGPRTANPAELLQSEAFGRLLDLLSKRYDRVIIDSPPVGAVTDPVILAAKSDGVIFVTLWEKTSKELAKRALKSVKDVGARVVGCILNGVVTSRLDYGYYYGYSYQAKYYGADARDS